MFPKIRMADLVWLPRGTEGRRAHLNRVLSKHVDFVVCDTPAVAPVLVVELDDASHEREDRRERDAFVDEALAAAGLAVLHVPARQTYAPAEVADLVLRAISGAGNRLPAGALHASAARPSQPLP